MRHLAQGGGGAKSSLVGKEGGIGALGWGGSLVCRGTLRGRGAPRCRTALPRGRGRGSPRPRPAPAVPVGAAAGTTAARSRRPCPARSRRGNSRGRRAPSAPGRGSPGGRAYLPAGLPPAPPPAARRGGSGPPPCHNPPCHNPPRRLTPPPPSWLWAVPGGERRGRAAGAGPAPARRGGRSRSQSPSAGERGGRNLPPKPSVAGRKNTWRRWAASRIAGFPRRGGGFLLVIYVLARLLTFTSFQSHLLKQEGKKLLEMAKKSTDDQVASWGQAGG